MKNWLRGENRRNSALFRLMALTATVGLLAACSSGDDGPSSAAPAPAPAPAPVEQEEEVWDIDTSRTLIIVVPFPPGGGIDAGARALAPLLAADLGVNVVVQNVAGSGGILGVSNVFQNVGDDYRLLLNITPINSILDVALSAPFDASTLVPVAAYAADNSLIGVRGGSSIQTFEDLVRESGERRLVHARGGTGSASHLQAAVLRSALPELRHVEVPYEGTAPASAAVLGGEADFIINTAAAHAGTPDLRLIASISQERHPSHPDVPTLAELGYNVPAVPQVFGLWAPPNTRPVVAQTYSDAVLRVLQTAEWIDFAQGRRLITTPFDFEAFGEVSRQAHILAGENRAQLTE